MDDRIQHQRQTIFTPDKIDVRFGEMENGLFERIFQINKTDETCEKYSQTIVGG